MKKAFTLIELIFVIVIIGILATVTMSRYEEIQDDAIAAVEKATAGEARHSILSFYGWALLHPGDQNKTVQIVSQDGTEYNCTIIFSSNRYPITLTAREVGVSTDNNYSVGSSTNIGDYKTLAPMMLDPSTIKEWNSTRIDSQFEHLNGPATNSVIYDNAELKKGMYWLYDNKNGHIMLKK